MEPFGGAGSVLLRKPRSPVEVYNDLDEEIVSLMRVVQNPSQCQRLMRLLRRTPYARAEFNRAIQRAKDPVVRAQRTIIRAGMAFNGCAIYNSFKGNFSHRHHITGKNRAKDWANYPRTLVAICRRLRGVYIECRNALDIIDAQDTPQTLFYLDPPYVPATRTSGGYRHEMTEEQHIELLERIKAVQGRAVICGYASELYDNMLSGWQRHTKEAHATNSHKKATEVVWIKPTT